MDSDLRQLVALDALIELRSVTAAAALLNTSQPAMSRTLAAIRRTTGDAVLVREGARMVTTPYADSIRDEVRELVRRGQAVLTPVRTIEPERLTRSFVLRANDALATAVLPRISERFSALAPSATLRVVGEPTTSAEHVRGSEDAWLGEVREAQPGTRHEQLGTTELVVVGSRSAIPAEGLDIDVFAARRHVVVSRRGRTRDRIDDTLEALGRQRRVHLTTPTVGMALSVLGADHSTICVMPAICVGLALGTQGLRAVPLPFETAAVAATLSWAEHLHTDPAQQWFRSVVAGTTRTALATPPE
ncbi:LysR family transcriptional regulator [Amnibacterium setariae]|uniref:LysR family transcriptional regulator n=1 Tax=Amnibacterium setariae TaxID=2306585 RepID=UPI00131413C9|nr:LysR family transcriptional regulator [Amnibacterium setariae]